MDVGDLPDFVSTGNALMYADDTTLYCIGPNVEHVVSNLNSVMDQISLWSMGNKLKLKLSQPANTEAKILRRTPFIGPIQLWFC